MDVIRIEYADDLSFINTPDFFLFDYHDFFFIIKFSLTLPGQILDKNK